MMPRVITYSFSLKAVCVCVPGFAPLGDPLSCSASNQPLPSYELEFLPICFRFNCHTVTLFKTAYCSMLPVFVIVYLYITFCWITGFQKYTQVLITNVGGRCFFLPPDEENEDAERNYMTHVGSLKPLENLSPHLPST